MKRRILFFLIGATICNALVAQRNLEVVAQPFTFEPFSTVVTDGAIVHIRNGNDCLFKYNDRAFSRYDFPSIGGARPTYNSISPLASFRSSTYVVIGVRGSGRNYLYAFNGGSFSRIGIPGSPVSGAVTFGDNLYILSEFDGLVRLYRYDERTVVEIPSASLPTGLVDIYDLQVEGSLLYIIARWRVPRYGTYIIKRYDGSTPFTLPSFESAGIIKKIFPVGATGNAYFLLGREDIFYYNGSSVDLIFDGDGTLGNTTNAVVWRNNLYFIYTEITHPAPVPVPINKAEGNIITQIPLPPGDNVFVHSNLAIYDDKLMIQVTDGVGNTRILAYDGVGFSDLFAVPGIINRYGTLFLRQGNLIILPAIGVGNTAYQYDGSTFTTIQGPAGYRLGSYLGSYLASTNCNHLWEMSYSDTVSFSPFVVRQAESIVKESRECPDTSSTVLVIPDYLIPFEKFTSVYGSKVDRECWSDIIVDWEIDPICPVPEICPHPSFQIALSDASGKIAWQHAFDKPINVSIPLDGKQSFKTTLSSIENESKELIVMDQDLVEKGITRIGFSMKPKEGIFQLTASTRSEVPVQLKVALLNKEGKSIWEKEFKAPFTEIINDRVAEPGEKLHFSVVAPQEDINTKIENSTSFTYLNSSHGTLSINVKDNQENAEAELMITTILGQKLVSKRIKIGANMRVELPQYKAGLYVIIIQTRDGRKTNKIVWLK